MLSEKLITQNKIIVIDKVDSWQESIKIAAKPLLDNNSIKEEYVTSIIDNINKLGFYIVLDEYIAMPHSRPENGVLKTDISFLKVNDGVMYGDDKIYLIFLLAAKDSNTHIDLIKNLLEIFDYKEKLINAKTLEEIRGVLK